MSDKLKRWNAEDDGDDVAPVTADEQRLEELLARMPRRSCPLGVRENVLAALDRELEARSPVMIETLSEDQAEAAPPAAIEEISSAAADAPALVQVEAPPPSPSEGRKPGRVVALPFRRRLVRILVEAAAIFAVAAIGAKVYFNLGPRMRVQPEELASWSDQSAPTAPVPADSYARDLSHRVDAAKAGLPEPASPAPAGASGSERVSALAPPAAVPAALAVASPVVDEKEGEPAKALGTGSASLEKNKALAEKTEALPLRRAEEGDGVARGRGDLKSDAGGLSLAEEKGGVTERNSFGSRNAPAVAGTAPATSPVQDETRSKVAAAPGAEPASAPGLAGGAKAPGPTGSPAPAQRLRSGGAVSETSLTDRTESAAKRAEPRSSARAAASPTPAKAAVAKGGEAAEEAVLPKSAMKFAPRRPAEGLAGGESSPNLLDVRANRGPEGEPPPVTVGKGGPVELKVEDRERLLLPKRGLASATAPSGAPTTRAEVVAIREAVVPGSGGGAAQGAATRYVAEGSSELRRVAPTARPGSVKDTDTAQKAVAGRMLGVVSESTETMGERPVDADKKAGDQPVQTAFAAGAALSAKAGVPGAGGGEPGKSDAFGRPKQAAEGRQVTAGGLGQASLDQFQIRQLQDVSQTVPSRPAATEAKDQAGTWYFNSSERFGIYELETTSPIREQTVAWDRISEIEPGQPAVVMAPPAAPVRTDQPSTWTQFTQNALASFSQLNGDFGGRISAAQDVILMPGNRRALLVECLVPVSNGTALMNSVNQKHLVAISNSDLAQLPQNERARFSFGLAQAAGENAQRGVPVLALRQNVQLQSNFVQRLNERDLTANGIAPSANLYVRTPPPEQLSRYQNRQNRFYNMGVAGQPPAAQPAPLQPAQTQSGQSQLGVALNVQQQPKPSTLNMGQYDVDGAIGTTDTRGRGEAGWGGRSGYGGGQNIAGFQNSQASSSNSANQKVQAAPMAEVQAQRAETRLYFILEPGQPIALLNANPDQQRAR